MFKNLKKRSEGFTIIEVLIVLAIAGLIMLIVFLAVPALQRNSRNTSIKNDVGNVLGGIAEYQAANGGAMPTGIAGTGTINYTGPAGTTATSIQVQGSTVVNTAAALPTTATAGTIQVRLGQKCNATVSTRAAAATYAFETTASSTNFACQDT